MQYCRGGKKLKRFSPGSDFTEQILTGELSGLDSAGVQRQDVYMIAKVLKILKETSNTEFISVKLQAYSVQTVHLL